MVYRCSRATCRLLFSFVTALVALHHAPPALAQPANVYPQRPIRVVIPYAPGGGSDILARFLAPRLTAEYGQQNKLYASLARHLNAPDLKPKLNDLDFDIVANTPEEFSDFIRSEILKFAKLVRDAGVKVE